MTASVRRLACLIALTSVAASCTDAKTVTDENVTGLRLRVEFDASITVDRLRVMGMYGDAVIPTTEFPAPPRALSSGETLVIVFPAGSGGSTATVRVDGFSGSTPSGTGMGSTGLSEGNLVDLTVTLAVPTVCGDGNVEAPEACDDAGTMAGDGCSAMCTVETGWTCEGNPSVCSPPECQNGVDDDGDGRLDLADPGCVDEVDPSELGDAECDDGLDNDGDGDVDFQLDGSGDAACLAPEGATEQSGTACNNGIDDEGEWGNDYRGTGAAGGAGSSDPIDHS
jgi:cysteine-rich repeat protein